MRVSKKFLFHRAHTNMWRISIILYCRTFLRGFVDGNSHSKLSELWRAIHLHSVWALWESQTFLPKLLIERTFTDRCKRGVFILTEKVFRSFFQLAAVLCIGLRSLHSVPILRSVGKIRSAWKMEKSLPLSCSSLNEIPADSQFLQSSMPKNLKQQCSNPNGTSE